MKNAPNFVLSCLGVACLSVVGFFYGQSASAQSLGESAVLAGVQASSTNSASQNVVPNGGTVIPEPIKLGSSSVDNADALKGHKEADSVSEKEDEAVPQSVKDIVGRLDENSKDINIGDLNEARAALARLDLLIDIEKRLGDLEETRQKREELKNPPIVLPASALAPPPLSPSPMPPQQNMQPAVVMPQLPPPPPPEAKVSVMRIVGTGGARSAVLRVDDDTKTVRQGDKLDDGSVVSSITTKTVVLRKDNKTRTIKVENINVVTQGR